MTYLAHAGHWTTSVLEVAPFLFMVVWLVIATRRDRKQESEEPDRNGPDPPPTTE